MQDFNKNIQPPDDDSPALADLLAPSDTPAEPFQIIDDSAIERPKRKQKRRFYITNVGMYAGVAGVAAITTLIVAGIVLIVAAPRLLEPAPFPTNIYPTPPASYDSYFWDWNTPLMTTDYVGPIPPNEQVYITSMNYDMTQQVWLYNIRDALSQSEGVAYEWQIMPPPQPTPTVFPFAQAIGMGYILITTESVGAIPANTRVRIIQASSDPGGFLYTIDAEIDHTTADARFYQLTYAPDVTPGITPTSPFRELIETKQFEFMTLEQIGDIPANTRVNVGSGSFNGHKWEYSIVTEDGHYADHVLQSQLTAVPVSFVTDTPAP